MALFQIRYDVCVNTMKHYFGGKLHTVFPFINWIDSMSGEMLDPLHWRMYRYNTDSVFSPNCIKSRSDRRYHWIFLHVSTSFAVLFFRGMIDWFYFTLFLCHCFQDSIFYVFDDICSASDFTLCVSTNFLPSDFSLLMSLSITIVFIKGFSFETSENWRTRNFAYFVQCNEQIWFSSYL